MPILSLPGAVAIRYRRNNPYSAWGTRNTENRVEPVASPAFDVPLRLKTGERIFTIGSCFARNVESELVRRGFRIPIRELFKQPEFSDLPREIVNSFGTPSIYNEFAWAFGEQTYDEEKNIVEVGRGKYVDLHMVNSIRPAPLETVRRRRQGLIYATRAMADCRVMIMTLGLVELWWDEETKSYLNTSPLPSVLKRYPDRFSLHVLSFEECHSYLRKALDIAFTNANDDLSVILTVSPVPMMETHQKTDVITANTYSKSVLRAVAEQLIAGDPRITYFPSFETVSLSNRNFAWTEDLVHVNKDMITLNVERMVNAYTGNKKTTTPVLADLEIEEAESAEALLLAERAREARMSEDDSFFEEHADAEASSPAFALEYAKFMYEARRFDEVLKIASKDERPEMQTLTARALIAEKKPEEAHDLIRALCLTELIGIEHWHVYVQAAIAIQSESALLQAEKEWIERQPRSRDYAQAMIGRALHDMGNNEEAVKRLLKAAALPDRHVVTVIDCAASLYALERYQEAQDMLEGVNGDNDWQMKRIRRLQKRISDALA